MTLFLPPPPPAGLRPQLSRVAWLLPALASSLLAAPVPHFGPRSAQAAERKSLPYLVAADPASIRFAPPPPDPVSEPAAAAPPTPDGPSEEIAAANHDARLPVTPSAHADSRMPTTAEAPSASPALPPQPASPATVLPDDLRPELRPEDVLPFFQPPGSNLILAIPPPAAAPSGAAQPASSATYRQL